MRGRDWCWACVVGVGCEGVSEMSERLSLLGEAGCVLIVVLAAAVAGVFVPAAEGGLVKVQCKLTGVRYVGTTAQKQQVCFTLSTDGRKLREYAYGFRDSCGASGDLRTTNPSRGFLATVAASGAFSVGRATSYFKGAVRGGKASGTLRSRSVVVGIGTCDTGMVRWTARRVG